MRGMITSKSS